MHQTVGTTEERVVGEFQTILGTILGAKHIADGALGQRSEGTTARIILLPVEATPVFRQREERQTLHLTERVVVDTARPDGPVQGSDGTDFLATDLAHEHFVVTFRQFHFELSYRTLWKYLVQPLTQAVELLHPQRVFLLAPGGVVGSCLEVEVDLILRDAAGHELSVATQDIAATRLHVHAVAFQTGSHVSPVLFLGSHDIHGLANDSHTQ